MSNNVSMGNKKKSYKSIRLAAEAAGKPVRKYERQTVAMLDRKATEFQEA